MKLTRRDTFAAAFGAAAAGAVPASAAASPSAATLPELALRARSMTPDDRLRGVVGYVLRRCEEGEKPNAWAAYGQKLEHGGIIYDSESLARYAAERDWPIIRDIQIEAGQLRRKLKAKRIPFEESDDDMIMVSDNRVWQRDEALEYLRDDERCWVYGTEEHPFNFDIEEALDSRLEDSFEEASEHVVDREGLRAFWKQWTAKQSLTSYYEDDSRILVLDAGEFAAQVKAWEDRLALLDGALARIEIEGAPATHLLFVCETVHEIARHMERNKDSWVYRRAVA